jgi:hypothetical protein
MFAAHGFRLKNIGKSPQANKLPKICAEYYSQENNPNSTTSKGGVKNQSIIPMNQKRKNYRRFRKEI